jgi:hypothetical protein
MKESRWWAPRSDDWATDNTRFTNAMPPCFPPAPKAHREATRQCPAHPWLRSVRQMVANPLPFSGGEKAELGRVRPQTTFRLSSKGTFNDDPKGLCVSTPGVAFTSPLVSETVIHKRFTAAAADPPAMRNEQPRLALRRM